MTQAEKRQRAAALHKLAQVGSSAPSVQEKGRGVPTAPFPPALRSCRFEHGQDTCRLGIRRCDSLKVCSDAAQLTVHKCIHEMQSAIQPREKFVLNLVMHRERNLGAIRTHLGKIDNSHQVEIAADRLESYFIRRIAFNGE